MLEYQNIYTINNAQQRLRRGYSWRSDNHTRESDQLLVFTLGEQARRESQSNLDLILDTARRYDMDVVVLRDNKIQVASAGTDRAKYVAQDLFTRDWLKKFNEWTDTTKWPTAPTIEDSGRGEYVGFHHYRHCFVMPEHVGVYEVATGRRIKNRKEIIQRYWDLGFATWRGRPASIAQLKWSGTREELEELTELADRYWTRGRNHRTDVAKKLVSAYRSINRYAAWPGAW